MSIKAHAICLEQYWSEWMNNKAFKLLSEDNVLISKLVIPVYLSIVGLINWFVDLIAKLFVKTSFIGMKVGRVI